MSKSMSFEEFRAYERDKIVNGKLNEPVSRMYSESLKLSETWSKEFKEFWDLPEDFEMEVNE